MDFFKRIPILHFIFEWMEANNMDYGGLAAGLSISLFLIGIFVFGVSGGQILSIFFALIPVWLPIILFFIFFYKWMDMKGTQFYLSQGRSTLRINLPPEVFKSPEAMEIVLAQIHNTQNPDNLMQTYLDGKRPLPFALEIVSIGGEVRFYVNVPTKKARDAFESNMYAQYPGVEIVEEPVDYAAEIALDDPAYNVFTLHFNKKEAEVFPIKTYIDYGLDKMPKEEEKNDPITPTLEILSSIRPFERLYIQIIIVAHRKQGFKFGQLVSKKTWEGSVKEKIDELMQRDSKTKGPLNSGDVSDFDGMPRLTTGERDTIEAMERNVEKYAYHTNIRATYITTEGNFNGNLINPLIRVFSQYDKIGRNQIGGKWRTDFNYMFISDPKGKRVAALKRQELKEYKLRKFFPKNGEDGAQLFTVEELATMFHLPGGVALTPTISRVTSNKAEAPANLPIGNLPV